MYLCLLLQQMIRNWESRCQIILESAWLTTIIHQWWTWDVWLHLKSIHYAATGHQTTENQATGCSKGNICSVCSGIWLAVDECSWVAGVKSACHRQLNGVPQCPTETPSSEQKCDKKLWMENRAGRRRQHRWERTGRYWLSWGDFTSSFWKQLHVHLCLHVCLSLALLALRTVTTVAPVTELFKMHPG